MLVKCESDYNPTLQGGVSYVLTMGFSPFTIRICCAKKIFLNYFGTLKKLYSLCVRKKNENAPPGFTY
jgi:hypothetical protein